jgi:hypothetical protein
MKRQQFVQELEQRGCILKRHGKRHDIYRNPANSRTAAVPRHVEIKDSLCRLIRRQLGIN